MCKAAMAHLRSILGGTSAALRVVGSDSIRAGSCSCMRWISFRSFFYRGHQLRQGVSDLREPHLGQMMTYGAGGHGDLTALLQAAMASPEARLPVMTSTANCWTSSALTAGVTR